ncbi:hypothetical protein [Parabacteroides sp. PF5-9]|uniref:hypothetical protein n=1 Tax=Parabacteroides sp. PF5-9 TaxID=1742404 RepID=UPI002474D5EC|nr:hypothetical protein [Parabacteroides sp. PF5-9]MDH6356253.1 hypothetical protein [Parabacteroides sp. PF5-9]
MNTEKIKELSWFLTNAIERFRDLVDYSRQIDNEEDYLPWDKEYTEAHSLFAKTSEWVRSKFRQEDFDRVYQEFIDELRDNMYEYTDDKLILAYINSEFGATSEYQQHNNFAESELWFYVAYNEYEDEAIINQGKEVGLILKLKQSVKEILSKLESMLFNDGVSLWRLRLTPSSLDAKLNDLYKFDKEDILKRHKTAIQLLSSDKKATPKGISDKEKGIIITAQLYGEIKAAEEEIKNEITKLGKAEKETLYSTDCLLSVLAKVVDLYNKEIKPYFEERPTVSAIQNQPFNHKWNEKQIATIAKELKGLGKIDKEDDFAKVMQGRQGCIDWKTTKTDLKIFLSYFCKQIQYSNTGIPEVIPNSKFPQKEAELLFTVKGERLTKGTFSISNNNEYDALFSTI